MMFTNDFIIDDCGQNEITQKYAMLTKYRIAL